MQGWLGEPVHRGRTKQLLWRNLQCHSAQPCPDVRAVQLLRKGFGQTLMVACPWICPSGSCFDWLRNLICSVSSIIQTTLVAHLNLICPSVSTAVIVYLTLVIHWFSLVVQYTLVTYSTPVCPSGKCSWSCTQAALQAACILERHNFLIMLVHSIRHNSGCTLKLDSSVFLGHALYLPHFRLNWGCMLERGHSAQ